MARSYTISTLSTGSTATITVTFRAGNSAFRMGPGTAPERGVEPKKKKKKKKKKKEVDVFACLEGVQLPRVEPARVFGSCSRCLVSVAMDAFGGRCSVCGRPLRVG